MDSIIGLLIIVVVGGFVVIYTNEINKTRNTITDEEYLDYNDSIP